MLVVERNWTITGEKVFADQEVKLEGGGRLTLDVVEQAIDELEWWFAIHATTLPAVPGLAIKAVISELRLPKVSAIAISDALAPYGFYGIEANYSNGRALVYVFDRGSELIPLRSDFWPKEG